jgi:hypothetical protein
MNLELELNNRRQNPFTKPKPVHNKNPAIAGFLSSVAKAGIEPRPPLGGYEPSSYTLTTENKIHSLNYKTST